MDDINSRQPNLGKSPASHQNPELITMDPIARQSLVTWFVVSYVLIIFFPIGSLIMAYVKKDECVGDPVLYSHAKNQIKICWPLLIGYLISMLLTLVFIGFITYFICFLWGTYRAVKGFSDLQKNIVVG